MAQPRGFGPGALRAAAAKVPASDTHSPVQVVVHLQVRDETGVGREESVGSKTERWESRGRC